MHVENAEINIHPINHRAVVAMLVTEAAMLLRSTRWMSCRRKQDKASAQHADVLCDYLLQVGFHS
jgi:hypothetical protein